MAYEDFPWDIPAQAWPPRPGLTAYVACVWAVAWKTARPLLPDTFVELVWSGRGLFVRGADTRAHPTGEFPDRTFVVVRFYPGAAGDVLGLQGHELADARVGIGDLWGASAMEQLESSLLTASSAREAGRILEDAVAGRVRRPPDEIVCAAVSRLRVGTPRPCVTTLAESLGLSERQLLRRCVAALGYGPKTLHRILRFQRFRRLASSGGSSLGELAWLAGYADQAHLTRECVRLSGQTPRAHLSTV